MNTLNQYNEVIEVNATNTNQPDRERVSAKYPLFSTHQIINEALKAGWVLEKVRFSRDKVYGKHLITLTHPMNLLKSKDEQVKIHVLNSHNGSCAAKVYLGVFRLVCSNGLMVGSSLFQSPKVIHSGNNALKFLEAFQYTQSQAEILQNEISKLKSIKLTDAQIHHFTRSALLLKYKDLDGFNTFELFQARRGADIENTLWNVFNRVQESLINGLYRRPYHDEYLQLHLKKARAIKSLPESIRINRGLWDLTKQFTINK